MSDPATLDIARLEGRAAQAARLLRVLGNERRLMILCRLVEAECSVGRLAGLVGLSQSALSQHLAVLRDEGVVATRRKAQTVWYRITDQSVLKVVATLAEIFCPLEPQS
jgi:ArsR family transcriptional regulator